MHFGERMRLDARGLMRLAASAFCALLVIGVGTANAQDRGTLNPQPLPPLTKAPGPGTPAKELAARKTKPSAGPARSLGFYSHGCIAGAVPLPINGETWQVMRVSRNRYYGHPDLIAFIERFADKATKVGWHGLLIGDMSQPRGGPLPAGHISHQVGLDVDVWLTPMPKHELTRLEREEMMATMTVAADRKDVNPKVWTPAHFALIKAAAEDPRVTRILVNTAIKKALCREAGEDRAWLGKIQPWLGHDWHFHIRISCPVDSPDCESQPARPTEDGCHGGEMTRWGANPLLPDHSMPRAGPAMSALPKACFDVLKEP
jgi:penicillin-insensitive murein DD-endopeptidase